MSLPAFHIDAAHGRFTNLRGCEPLSGRFGMPAFSVGEILAMAGATVHGYGHFHSGEMDAGFERDVKSVYGIVMKNPKGWGEFVGWLQAVCGGAPAGRLTAAGPRRVKAGRGPAGANPALLECLREAGLLTQVALGEDRAEITFKSPLIRRCLLIEGIWLELFCYVTARASAAFHDVRTSVVVDWDGVEGGGDTAKNEVDVLLVRQAVPVFISCKMSLPSALALGEIKLLAEKFGGALSKAAVFTAGRLGDEHRALKARAADLGVALLEASALGGPALPRALLALTAPPPPQAARLANLNMLPRRKTP
jgi:hypothetical protein